MVDTVVVQTPEAGFEAPAEEAGAAAPEATQEQSSDRPAWLPEKFKSAEDMAAAYAELEKKLGAPAEEKPAEDSAEEKPEDASQEETEEETKDDTEDKAGDADLGAAIEEATKNFAENGEVSEADFERFEKLGIPRDVVEGYAKGQAALAEAATKQMNDAAGGEEQFQTMALWASQNMPQAEIDELNKAFDSADVNTAVMAVETLKAKYEEANGVTPKLVGGSKANAGADVYQSWAQVTADMGKPEYSADPAFRAKVEAKLARSNI